MSGWIGIAGVALAGMVAAPPAVQGGQAAGASSVLTTVASKDGTPIGVECAGSGPTLLFVHGGVGDRRRWTPMFPLLLIGETTASPHAKRSIEALQAALPDARRVVLARQEHNAMDGGRDVLVKAILDFVGPPR